MTTTARELMRRADEAKEKTAALQEADRLKAVR